MLLKGKRVGFAVTGSHCTLAAVIPELVRLVDEGAQIVPIISQAVRDNDTRFGTSAYFREELERISGHEVIDSINLAEPIGPQKLFDIITVAPCTGNTLAKIANSITDTPVLMAVKAQLRNLRPVVLAISTNDGLGGNAINLGRVLNMKNIYLVPLGQDDPYNKATSLVFKKGLILDTVLAALEGRQIQPLLLGPPEKGTGDRRI